MPRPTLFPLAPAPAALWLGVFGAAIAASAVAALYGGGPNASEWLAFAVLAVAAAGAQLFVVRTGLNQGFHTALVFITAAALLLPPELLPLLALLQHLPEWIKERYPGYIQLFNAANFAVNGLAGWGVAHVLRSALPGSAEVRWAAAGAGAAVTIILLNHVVLATMLKLARGHSLRESELFTARALGLDLVLGLLGITAALCWRANPWVLPTLVAPLFAAQRAFGMTGLLRESEQRFRAMFAAAPFGVELTDLDGTIVDANLALEQMLGYPASELATLPRESYVSAADDAKDRKLLAELVAGERSEYELERRFTTSAGDSLLAHVAVALVPDADGRPKYRLAMVEDVTQRAALEEQLRQAQRLEVVGRLAGGVAHDFNNLLTVITGHAQIAREQLPATCDATRADLDEIVTASTRATALTAQLLAFSRKQLLQPKDVNLNDIVSDLHSMLRRLIGEHVELSTIFYGPEMPHIRADPGQIEQVIVNLVVNARDAMPGGGEITIETSSVVVASDSPLLGEEGAEAGTYAVLAVRDTGVGIEPGMVKQLFEPFFTTKKVGDGTGLGLATVYGIVRQSGGFLGVSSAPGRGSTFTIYLPRLVSAPADAVDVPAAEPIRGREHVLLVEDEAAVRSLVQRMLEGHGYDVFAAVDGAAALERAREVEGPIDVLLTDVVMPSMSGRELADRFREIHPETLVLYMSGYIDTTILGPEELGARAHFLQKPFGATELTEGIRRLVDDASELSVQKV